MGVYCPINLPWKYVDVLHDANEKLEFARLYKFVHIRAQHMAHLMKNWTCAIHNLLHLSSCLSPFTVSDINESSHIH